MNRLRVPDSISISIGFAAGAGMAGMAGMTLNAAAGEGRAEFPKTELGKAELGRAKLGSEPGKAAGKAEPGKPEPGKPEPGMVELVKIGVPSSKSSRPRPWIVRS